MTPAERQRAHRKRQWEAAVEAYSSPEGKPAKALLGGLELLLAGLDDPERTDMHDTQRELAGRAIRELVKRYGLRTKAA